MAGRDTIKRGLMSGTPALAGYNALNDLVQADRQGGGMDPTMGLLPPPPGAGMGDPIDPMMGPPPLDPMSGMDGMLGTGAPMGAGGGMGGGSAMPPPSMPTENLMGTGAMLQRGGNGPVLDLFLKYLMGAR